MTPELIAFLKANATTILQRATEGDVLCSKIITLYSLSRSAPGDPGAAGLLQAAIRDYQERENVKDA